MSTDAGPVGISNPNRKPILFTMFCVFVVMVLQIIDVTKKSDSCSADAADDDSAPMTMTSDELKDTTNSDLEQKIEQLRTDIQELKTTPSSPPTDPPVTPPRDDSKDNVVVIGTDGEWPPYCHHTYTPDNETGQTKLSPSGFIYDFAVEACERAGLDCKFPLTGKWDQCWGRENNAGTGLLSDQYDMCLCWVMTPGRMARVLFPLNKDRGWTKQSEGGFLTLSKYEGDDTPYMGSTRWDYMKMVWTDGCNGSSMIQLDNGDWVDDCTDTDPQDDSSCGKKCPQGKIRIGYVNGWALKPESFNWIVNEHTGEAPDMSRVIFIDEHTDGEGRTSNSDYNHVAKALLNDDIDMAYTFGNAIEAMQTTDCNICTDNEVWRDGSLKFHQKKLYYSSGGVSAFMKYGKQSLADKLNVGVEDLIADKATYCPMCIKYWKTQRDCEDHCIGCGATNGDGTSTETDYCKPLHT